MSKPREFWIQDCSKTMDEGVSYASSFSTIHVIEYSAYQKVVERLKESLENEYEFFLPENLNLADTDMRTYVAQELAKLGVE